MVKKKGGWVEIEKQNQENPIYRTTIKKKKKRKTS